MRRPLRWLGLCLGVVFVAALVTPLGPFALTRLIEGDSGEWRIGVGGQSGALLFGYSLVDFHGRNETLGLEIAIERLKIKPWSWEVELQAPRIRIDPVVATSDPIAESPADIELPIAFLPDFSANAGRLDWHFGETSLEVRDWNARYRALSDTSGLLELVLLELDHLDPLDSLKLDLMLSTQRIDIGRIEAWGERDSVKVGVKGSFELGLALPRPLSAMVVATAAAPADSLRGHLEAAFEGALEPLQLSGMLNGRGSVPVLADIDLRGVLSTDGTRLVLDSLLVSLLDGELTGQLAYFPASDSVQTQLRGAGFELAALAPVAGRTNFALEASANLVHQRFAADFAATLRDVELIAGDPVDVDLEAWHRPDGATRLVLESRLLTLLATGSADLQRDYDLVLEGTLRPAPFLAEAGPVAIAGRARPDTLGLHLETDHLPGVMGDLFGSFDADLTLVANRDLEALVRLERDLLVARAEIDLDQGRVDTLVANLDGLALTRIAPELDGYLGATLRGGGGLAFEELRLTGRAETSVWDYAGWQGDEWVLDFAWDQGVAQAEMRGRGLRVQAELDEHRRLVARADFDGTVARGSDDDEIGVVGTLNWAGPLDDPDTGAGELALDSLLLRQDGWALRNRGPLALDYRSGRATLQALDVQTPFGPLDFSGWVGLDSLSVAAAFPALVLDGLLPDLRGEGSGHLHLGGTFARPEAEGGLTLSGLHLDTLALGDAWLRLTLGDSLVARAGLGVDEEIHLVLEAPAPPLWGQGQGRAELEIEAVAADLGPLLSYALGHPLRSRVDLDGILEAVLGDSLTGVAGIALWDGLSGQVEVSGAMIETRVEDEVLRLDLLSAGRFELNGGRVMLDSLAIGMRRYDRDRQALQPAGTLRLEGELAAELPSRVGLALEDVDLVFFGGPEGTADLEAWAHGVISDPELVVELAVDTEDFGELNGRLTGGGRGGDLHLNWMTLLEDSLVVTGHLPWDLAAGEIALDKGWLEAHSAGIGLFIFSDLMADLDHLDGMIGADLRVVGLDSTLDLQGRVDIEGFEFALLDITPTYVLPDGWLQFDGRKVALDGFAVRNEPKRGYRSLELKGQLDLEQLADPGFDIELQARRVVCRYEDIFQADDIDLDLSFSGTASRSKLAGRIRLKSPRSEPTLVVFNAPPIPPPPPALRDDFLENMSLDVELDLRALTLDSELAEVEASGAVEVGGTFYKPLFQGDLSIDEGRVYLLNQHFEFEQGRAVFNSLEPTGSILDVAYDPLELDPELDLRAVTRVRDIQDEDEDEEYVVTFTLAGRATEATPELTSDPSLDFRRIINLLAFNTASTQNLDYTTALGTAAGQLLSRRVERVGLDEFAVLPSSTVVGALPGDPALRVGKFFGGLPLPLWVRYEALLKEMSSGEVRIEHKLKSFLTITGSAQSQYDRYGLGIGLKKEF